MKCGDFREIETQPIDDWAAYEAFFGLGEIDKWTGRAFTVVENGKPIGISGFSLDDEGTGKGWLIGSRALRSKPIFLHRTMKRVLAEIKKDRRVKKIEITVERKHRDAVRWVERLGFAVEEQGAEYARYVM